ncbi:hypothetical protein HDV00_007081 [Rhizophlyctis rosea]|nr:hypothetical protein HDV00_007081 [Rhizophlyctis rosea]
MEIQSPISTISKKALPEAGEFIEVVFFGGVLTSLHKPMPGSKFSNDEAPKPQSGQVEEVVINNGTLRRKLSKKQVKKLLQSLEEHKGDYLVDFSHCEPWRTSDQHLVWREKTVREESEEEDSESEESIVEYGRFGWAPIEGDLRESEAESDDSGDEETSGLVEWGPKADGRR